MNIINPSKNIAKKILAAQLLKDLYSKKDLSSKKEFGELEKELENQSITETQSVTYYKIGAMAGFEASLEVFYPMWLTIQCLYGIEFDADFFYNRLYPMIGISYRF